MNAEALLQHFERNTDTPDAIGRLRRFVLDLAVRGKLVSQDSKEEPAAGLLARISVEKARLLATGEVRTPKTLPRIADVPFEIPQSWRWTQIAEIGLLSPRNAAADDLPASFVPMTLITAEYGAAHGNEVRPWGEIKNGYTHFANGDVGLAKITPCFENGKSTVFRSLSSGIGSGTTELHVVRPLFVTAEYVALFLKCPHFIEAGIPKMTGTAGQKRVPTEYFAYSAFPLPPLAEQDRIVAKVNELMALCDQLEAARAKREAARDRLAAATLARLNVPDPVTFADDARFALDVLPALTARPDQVKQLRQTILDLAIRGKLVAQDPGDEAFHDLFKRVSFSKSDLSGASRCQDTDIDGLPANWIAAKISEIANVGTGLTPSRSKPEYFEPADIPWVTSGETSDAFVNSAVQHVSTLALKETSLKVYPPGTLLIAMYGQGKTRGQVTELNIAATTNQACAAIVLLVADEAHRRYVKIFFQKMYDEIRERSAGGAQPNLNVGKIKSTAIPLPPIAEQHRIVAKVTELMALCDRLEASVSAGEVCRCRLLDALISQSLEPADSFERT